MTTCQSSRYGNCKLMTTGRGQWAGRLGAAGAGAGAGAGVTVYDGPGLNGALMCIGTAVVPQWSCIIASSRSTFGK